MRVNLIHPKFLTDEHLIAEINEINMISGMFLKSLNSKSGVKFEKIPKNYCLGTGHVYFFYNKGKYLSHRYYELKKEAVQRGINITLDFNNQFHLINCGKAGFYLGEDYEPTLEALELIINRICEKVMLKPDYYSYTYDDVVYKIDAEKYCKFLKSNLNGNYDYVIYFLKSYFLNNY